VQLVATAAGREPDEVAGKPMPQPFLEAARRYAAVRPLVIGDRLDTDLEGARAADMPGLAVLTGVSTAGDLVRAAPHVRPTYIGIDLGSLLVPHPDVVVSVVGPTVSATCVDAVVAVSAGTAARGARLEVSEPGKDAVDLLRAACGAAWAYADGQNAVGAHAASLDLNDVLASVQRLDATATWAR
jgi:hypothetical protein